MNERDRIELIMKSYNLTPSQFADKTGIQRASVSHILSGRNKASLEVMLKIFDAFPGLDMQWLMTGKGNAPVASGVQETVPQSSSAAMQSELFSEPVPSPVEFIASQPQKVVQRPVAVVERVASRRVTRVAQQPQQPVAVRKIKEIRVFYSDGTYEILYPEK